MGALSPEKQLYALARRSDTGCIEINKKKEILSLSRQSLQWNWTISLHSSRPCFLSHKVFLQWATAQNWQQKKIFRAQPYYSQDDNSLTGHTFSTLQKGLSVWTFKWARGTQQIDVLVSIYNAFMSWSSMMISFRKVADTGFEQPNWETDFWGWKSSESRLSCINANRWQ